MTSDLMPADYAAFLAVLKQKLPEIRGASPKIASICWNWGESGLTNKIMQQAAAQIL